MIRVGIIGRGNIGKRHEMIYERIRKEGFPVEISAFCDTREEQAADSGTVRVYSDVDTFLQEEQGKLDYVDICLPTFLHAETVIKALKAGFHVLCEKPMALNTEQAQEMLDTAKRYDRKLMIAHCCRFMGYSRIMKEVVESGEFGKVRNAEFRRQGGGAKTMGYQNWLFRKELSGGAMLDAHIHDVDLINWMFGMPCAVSAAAANVIPGSGYDSMSVNYLYKEGMYVTAKCDWTISHNRYNGCSARINFEKGYLYFDMSADSSTFVKVDEDGNVQDLWDKAEADSVNAAYKEIRYFMHCLQNACPVTECPPKQSAEAVGIVMAEMRSADLGSERIALCQGTGNQC